MRNEWDEAAAVYSKIQEDSVYSLFNKDFVASFVHDPRGKTVLDAGCGDGFYSDYFRRSGADVTGCDGSCEMIRIAREKYPGISFDLTDLQSVLPYPSGRFDIVFCNLVLMDVERIEPFLSEVSRVLKSGGKFYFSIVHPCFFTAEWEKDEYGRKGCKKVDDYLRPQAQKNSFWGVTTHYHRPISHYLNLMSDNGLILEKLCEPGIDNGIDDSHLRIPLFLFARLTKR